MMPSIACASGKGGTGKTTVATNLARIMAYERDTHLVDCDVEGPNAHHFFTLESTQRSPVHVPVPHIDLSHCDLCGVCSDACAFHAISVLADTALVFPELCHGCGVCAYICPRNAITERPRTIGSVLEATCDGMAFTGGSLNPGEPMPPPIIQAAKKTARGRDYIIIDASPGSTCATVEAVHGTNFCLLVTEPTPFGLSDLRMAVGMCRRLDVPYGVVINRSDLGDGRVEDYCKEEAIPVLGRFPSDRCIADVYARGALIVDHNSAWEDRFRGLLMALDRLLKREVNHG